MKRTLSIIAAMFVVAMAYSQTPELRPEVFDLIDLDRSGMENVKALHQNGQDAEAASALLDYYRGRKGIVTATIRDLSKVKISPEEKKEIQAEMIEEATAAAGDANSEVETQSEFQEEEYDNLSFLDDFDEDTAKVLADLDDSEFDGETEEFSTRLIGRHNVLNIVGAIAISHKMGIQLKDLRGQVRKLEGVPHRLQLSDKGNVTIIDDAYNSNPSGCRAALAVLGLFDACRILVTPGMVELGAKQEELNYEFGQEASKACDYIVLVGKKQTEPIYNGIKDSGYDMSKVYVADSLNDALAKVNAYTTDKKKIVLLENDLPDNY